MSPLTWNLVFLAALVVVGRLGEALGKKLARLKVASSGSDSDKNQDDGDDKQEPGGLVGQTEASEQ